ncbi:putative ATP-grasp-modified RiPP [Streptomyces sp. NPDC026294]|uniref:putative ATP-grasp-modified RiPP n=1 Tax=Streptomyces sp. NPDC026294 TaxID=3155362 RepID=UPI00340E2D6F
MSVPVPAPWGLSRMKPYPACAVATTPSRLELDEATQTVRWLEADGSELPTLDRHKKSETSKETNTSTSLDGNTDQGHDQDGDED